MAVERLAHKLHAREERVARDCVPHVVVANERGERRRVAVSLAGVVRFVLPPELRDLREPARDPRALGFAVLRDQLLFEGSHQIGAPQWLRPCERRDPSQHKHESAQTWNGLRRRIAVCIQRKIHEDKRSGCKTRSATRSACGRSESRPSSSRPTDAGPGATACWRQRSGTAARAFANQRTRSRTRAEVRNRSETACGVAPKVRRSRALGWLLIVRR